MSWQPLAPESGFYFLNAHIFMSQKRFFVPVISHNIFSSLFESGNNSTSLNSCLPASNVTFLFVFFQSYVCQLSLCPFRLLGESSLPVALLVFGVRSGFRGGLQMPVSLMLVQASWSAVKLRGVSFGTPMRWNETRRSIVGSSCLGWVCLLSPPGHRKTKKPVQEVWLRLQ